MLAGFAAAFLIGDLCLVVLGASLSSPKFLFGVAGFSLAQVLWTVGQLREARPDARAFLAFSVPLAAFVLCRLRPPALPPSAEAAVCVYSVLTALSLSTAIATRRAFYACGIGLLLFSDLMIGWQILHVPGSGLAIGPAYVMAELCLIASFFAGDREPRLSVGGRGVWRFAAVGGIAAFALFAAAATLYPGGGYNPLRQMLSELGHASVRKVVYPPCHHLFVAGLLLSAACVGIVWAHLVRRIGGGWRRVATGWGGALNVAGLCTIALVPFDVWGDVHNLACNAAVIGGVAVMSARFDRRWSCDWAWATWLVAVVVAFVICLEVKGIPFRPYVTTLQKVLIVSFALWTGHLAWRERQ